MMPLCLYHDFHFHDNITIDTLRHTPPLIDVEFAIRASETVWRNAWREMRAADGARYSAARERVDKSTCKMRVVSARR